jgi:hypothetical protein
VGIFILKLYSPLSLPRRDPVIAENDTNKKYLYLQRERQAEEYRSIRAWDTQAMAGSSDRANYRKPS